MNQSALLSRFITISVFFIFGLGMSIGNGYSIGAAILLLTSIFFYIQQYKAKLLVSLSAQDKWLIALCIIYPLAAIVSLLITGDNIRQFDRPIRLLLSIPIFYLIFRQGLSRKALFLSLAIGGICIGGVALYQVHILHLDRAHGNTVAIQFGNIGVLIGMLSCIAIFFVPSQLSYKKGLQCLLLLGCLGGCCASILSGSRGGWPAIIIAIVLLMIYFNKVKWQHLSVAAAIAVAVGTYIYYSPDNYIHQRIQESISEVVHYKPNTNSSATNSSVGARLEMWRLSMKLIAERPILGWGKDGYLAQMQEFANRGETTQLVSSFGHPHNDLINAQVKQGILGGLTLLGLYLIPLCLFASHRKSANQAVRFYSIAGVLVVLSYILFGLTQAFLRHNNGMMYYVLFITLFWGGLRHAEAQLSNQK
ncbi:O-antigen ligase family protein [Pelistega europaea]|uniref:O-antigen ligase family protein n=1 Tax=Pelistega europaea TaxID=106147 RepID=A0A7Y4LCX0_9BURK|nr:O-antigen ligase family protein [Pelistega europaea]NOL49916.1 O-antigen ligase family protein [Pelistega europaea]